MRWWLTKKKHTRMNAIVLMIALLISYHHNKSTQHEANDSRQSIDLNYATHKFEKKSDLATAIKSISNKSHLQNRHNRTISVDCFD